MAPPRSSAGAMTHAARSTSESLQEAAARLVAERRDLPPGSVLRCFCRSVRSALLAGCPPTLVAPEAERLTRELLAGRLHGEERPRLATRPVAGPRVPVARRAC